MERFTSLRVGNCSSGLAIRRKHPARVAPTTRRADAIAVGLAVILLLFLTGCGELSPSVSSKADLVAFKNAGPVHLKADLKELLGTMMSRGSYRPVPGDVLQLQLPVIIRRLSTESNDETEQYLCRVSPAGTIVLPTAGEVKVAGRTLVEIEAAVVKLYYPKYVLEKPSIVASVTEYRTIAVSVVGAVVKPGMYELRSNEKTLVCALMKAEGITKEGATAAHIRRSGRDAPTISIPVVGMNIPSRDVELEDGDAVVVETLEPQVITVIGLVKKPGLFPWSHKRKYNVMDALAFAGGIDDVADPQFVKVYRQDADGKVISAVLKLNGESAVGASDLYLKPGDVVAVEQTARTRARVILAQVFRIGFGVNAGASATAR